MATSSIFTKFKIDSDETLKILVNEMNNTKKSKTPKIDVQKEIDRGVKLLKSN